MNKEIPSTDTFSILREARPLIMGILNITPDSFSDGGMFTSQEAAIQHALDIVRQGADIIDVGGESTRPGSCRVEIAEQIKRVEPIIRRIRQHFPNGPLISIDTTHVAVAEAALRAGANIINDVSAGRDDPEMFDFVAAQGVPIILMHMQGTPESMQDNPDYGDVVEEVYTFLEARAALALKAGINPERIIIDPGIGFGKRRIHNLLLISELERFTQLGYPVLLGASRKRFMGSICGELDANNLLGATVATTAYGVMKGVKIFRVHDVFANKQAADVIAAIVGVVK